MADCCYRCEVCSRVVCMDAAPSPGEQESLCADCFELEDDAAVVA